MNKGGSKLRNGVVKVDDGVKEVCGKLGEGGEKIGNVGNDDGGNRML
ncbi:hypothetical protein [Bacillus thuringiensis]|nr:hypothetical protein [Bacillus thuringiensis]